MIEFRVLPEGACFVLSKSACAVLLKNTQDDNDQLSLAQAEFDFGARQVAVTTGHTLLFWCAGPLPEFTERVRRLVRPRDIEKCSYVSRTLLAQVVKLATRKVDVLVFADRVTVGDVTLPLPKCTKWAFPPVSLVVPVAELLQSSSGSFQLSALYLARASDLADVVDLGRDNPVTVARLASKTLLFGGAPTGPYTLFGVMDVGQPGTSSWAHVLGAKASPHG